MKQKTISNFFPTADISKQVIITNMILSQLICGDLQPFSIVEDPGFNEFISIYAQHTECPQGNIFQPLF